MRTLNIKKQQKGLNADGNKSTQNLNSKRHHLQSAKKHRIESFGDAIEGCHMVQQTNMAQSGNRSPAHQLSPSQQEALKNGVDKCESPALTKEQQAQQQDELLLPPLHRLTGQTVTSQQQTADQQDASKTDDHQNTTKKSNSIRSSKRHSPEKQPAQQESDSNSSSFTSSSGSSSNQDESQQSNSLNSSQSEAGNENINDICIQVSKLRDSDDEQNSNSNKPSKSITLPAPLLQQQDTLMNGKKTVNNLINNTSSGGSGQRSSENRSKFGRTQSEESGGLTIPKMNPLMKLETSIHKGGTPLANAFSNEINKMGVSQVRSIKTMHFNKRPKQNRSSLGVLSNDIGGTKDMPKFIPISQMELLKQANEEVASAKASCTNTNIGGGNKKDDKNNLLELHTMQHAKTFQSPSRKNSLKDVDNAQNNIGDGIQTSYTMDKMERMNNKSRNSPEKDNDSASSAHAVGDNQDFLISQPNNLDSPLPTVRRKKCLFYPQDKLKQIWDLICGICLIVSCLTIPFYLAIYFDEDEKLSSIYINAIVDSCFFLDILVTFNTAVHVSQVKIVEDRKQIAKMYLKKWFWIDLLVTLPYDQIISLYNPSFQNVVALSKFVRIMKIVRLVRLLKLIKVAKDRKKMAAILASSLQLNYAIERLVLSIFGFLLLCHVIACFWILQVKLNDSVHTKNWIEEKGFLHSEDWELYFAAYYFSVTTFTTVGYGDIHATCTIERICAIFLMIGGVFAFSFATGTLTSILTSLDATNKQINEKMLVVNKLSQRYNLDDEIKSKLHATVRFQIQNSTDEFTEFLSQLDPRLRQRVYREMYKLTQKKISFFQKKTDQNFIEWICPLLKVIVLISDMPVYREQEEIQAIYFLEQGEAAYVLPRYQNAPFVTIQASETFGLIDIMFRMMELDCDAKKEQDLFTEQKIMRHKFTCHTQKNSIILQFSMEDLKRMELEYKEVYEELFDEQDLLLERALEQKAKAQHLYEAFDEMDSAVSVSKSSKRRKRRRQSKRGNGGHRRKGDKNSKGHGDRKSKKKSKMLLIEQQNQGSSLKLDSSELKHSSGNLTQQSLSIQQESQAQHFEHGKSHSGSPPMGQMMDSGGLNGHQSSELSTPPQAVKTLAQVDERSDEIDESQASSSNSSEQSSHTSQTSDSNEQSKNSTERKRRNKNETGQGQQGEDESPSVRHSSWNSSDSSDGGNPKDGNGGNVKQGAASPKLDTQDLLITQDNNNLATSIENMLSQSVQMHASHSTPPYHHPIDSHSSAGFYSQLGVNQGNLTSSGSGKDRENKVTPSKKEQKRKDDQDEAKIIKQMRMERNTGGSGNMKRRFSLMPRAPTQGLPGMPNFHLDQKLTLAKRSHNNSLILTNRQDSLIPQPYLIGATGTPFLPPEFLNIDTPQPLRPENNSKFDSHSSAQQPSGSQAQLLSNNGSAMSFQPTPNLLPTAMLNRSTDTNLSAELLNAQLQRLQQDFQQQLSQVVQQFQIGQYSTQQANPLNSSPTKLQSGNLLNIPRMPAKTKTRSQNSLKEGEAVSEKNQSQEESSNSRPSSARSGKSKAMQDFDAFETGSEHSSVVLSTDEVKQGNAKKGSHHVRTRSQANSSRQSQLKLQDGSESANASGLVQSGRNSPQNQSFQ